MNKRVFKILSLHFAIKHIVLALNISLVSAMSFVFTNNIEADGACSVFAIVSTMSELNDAIACFNSGNADAEIRVGGDIVLSAETVPINGSGYDLRIYSLSNYAIDGNDRYRLFTIEGGAVTIDSLTLRNGNSHAGGAIYNDGDSVLTIKNSTVTNNSVTSLGGGIYNGQGLELTVNNSVFTYNSADKGGGIYNNEVVDIVDSTFAHNTASSSGGAIHFEFLPGNEFTLPRLTVNNSHLNHNHATNGVGGAIYSNARLDLTDSRFTANSALSGGGVYSEPHGWDELIGEYIGGLSIGGCTFTTNSARSAGGAIWAGGELTASPPSIEFTEIKDNSAQEGAGLYVHHLQEFDISITTIRNNDASVNGGGLYLRGSIVTINDSTIRQNTAVEKGGGVFQSGGSLSLKLQSALNNNSATGTSGQGGGLYKDQGVFLIDDGGVTYNRAVIGGGLFNNAGTVTLKTAYFEGNGATNTGGAVFNGGKLEVHDGEMYMNGADVAGGAIMNIAQAEIHSSRLVENSTGGIGGGIASYSALTLTHSHVLTNVANLGAGVGVYGSGFVEQSTFLGNAADADGGAIAVFDSDSSVHLRFSTLLGNSAEKSGGGIYVYEDGNLRVANSGFYENTASHHGGGIANLGSTTLFNTTLSQNRAVFFGGGAITFGEDFTAVNNTFFNNRGELGGGGLNYAGPASLYNTIVIANTTSSSLYERDLEGTSTGTLNGSNNLIGDPTSAGSFVNGSSGNIVGVGGVSEIPWGEVLEALADNGGPTKTNALTSNSPAISHGSAPLCSALSELQTDQRGYIRDSFCDIGAYEVNAAVPTAIRLKAQSVETTLISILLITSAVLLTVLASVSQTHARHATNARKSSTVSTGFRK